jgi:hypothetical protein
MGMVGALGTGAVVLFGKTKYIIGALKLTKLARYVFCLFGRGKKALLQYYFLSIIRCLY